MRRQHYGFIDGSTQAPKYPVSELASRLAGFKPNDEGFVLKTEQRVDQIAEECRHYRTHHPTNGFSNDGNRQLVARIPNIIGHQLIKRYGPQIFQDDRMLNRWLNSSEASPWRTSSGDV